MMKEACAAILKCVKLLLANWQLDLVVAQELRLFGNIVALLFLQFNLILTQTSQCIKETIKPLLHFMGNFLLCFVGRLQNCTKLLQFVIREPLYLQFTAF